MPSPTDDPPVACPLRRAWGFPGRDGSTVGGGYNHNRLATQGLLWEQSGGSAPVIVVVVSV